MKKANYFDEIFGYVRKFHYLCIVRETHKDKKKFLNIKYYETEKNQI